MPLTKDHQSLRTSSHAQAKGLDVPPYMRTRFRRALSWLLCLWYSKIVVRIGVLLQEGRSFLGHISVRFAGMRFVSISQDPALDPTSHPAFRTYSRARICHTQQMLASHPWASLVDLQLFLEGWDKGEKLGREVGKHGRDFCTTESESNSSSSESLSR